MADVLIVGGGPAGSATAIELLRHGHRVTLLDKARFPRPKPCAEYISPGVVKQLQRLGVWSTVQAAGGAGTQLIAPVLRGFMLTSPAGHSATGDFVEGFGTAITRSNLDALLLEHARCLGAEVVEGCRVGDLLWDDGRVSGVATQLANGKPATFRARLVVGADGLRSVVARRLKALRQPEGPPHLGLVSHYTGVADLKPYGEMHIGHGAYCGTAPLGDGLVNVGMAVDARRGREIAADPRSFFERTVAGFGGLRGRFEDARPVDGVWVIGPFGQRSIRAAWDGALLVGDAADFYDPFTGQGIYSALRGAQLAAGVAHCALTRGDVSARGMAEYDRLRRATFSGKWLVERIIQFFVRRPPLINSVLRNMSARPDLASVMVSVTGDILPTSRVLTPGFLLRVLR
jgi:geranylgeranyl reductase family protein